ncbi:ferrous iron transport protein A [Kitasatospora sp. NPDC094019]|uniref:ferrous iron transport protein A n=1 Tax=Kitasatospora sp. NPDC094019 TaxID=3364091 RepID=UPI0038229351
MVVSDPLTGGPWEVDFPGSIDDTGAPEPVLHTSAEPGELAYWVSFDEPQYDSGGSGPYRKAQIWARYLRPARTDAPSDRQSNDR